MTKTLKKTVTRKAPAKINLSLQIVGKREDGYHLLESVVAFTEFGDEIQVIESDKLLLEVIGEFGHSLSSQPQENNLVWKAAVALQRYLPQPSGAHIILIKNLPIASGIGGGSADAAATINALCELWKLDIPEKKLNEIALALGSDVPVCLYGKSAIMRGIGEVIIPTSLPQQYFITLINPNISLPTAEVFRDFVYQPQNNTAAPEQYTNDLEKTAIKKAPIIEKILASLQATEGCISARMSGSGATCFGLYNDKIAAENAKKELQNAYPQAWCISSVIK